MAAFLFDNDTHMGVARWLVRRGHATTSLRQLAPALGLDRAGDGEVLTHAAVFRLILVTHNEEHFVALHDVRDQSHAGIIAIPQVDFDTVVAAGDAINRLVTSYAVEDTLFRWRQGSGWERRLPTREWQTL